VKAAAGVLIAAAGHKPYLLNKPGLRKVLSFRLLIMLLIHNIFHFEAAGRSATIDLGVQQNILVTCTYQSLNMHYLHNSGNLQATVKLKTLEDPCSRKTQAFTMNHSLTTDPGATWALSMNYIQQGQTKILWHNASSLLCSCNKPHLLSGSSHHNSKQVAAV